MTDRTNAECAADARPSSGPLDILEILRQWRTLATCAAVSLVLGAVYLIVAPATYEAEARVLVQKEGLSLDRRDLVRAEKHFLETQAEVIGSPLTVSQAVQVACPTTPVSKAVAALRVDPVVDTNVLKISYRSRQSTEPGAMIHAVIEAYRTHLKEVERDTYTETLVLLSDQEKHVRRELEELESQYEELRRGNSLVGQGDDAFHVQTMQLRHLSEQLVTTKGNRIALENKLHGLALAVKGNREQLHAISTAGELAGWQIASHVREPDVAMAFYAAIADNSVYDSAAQQLIREEASSRIRAIADAERELAATQSKLHELERKFGYKHQELLAVQRQVAGWKELRTQRRSDWVRFLGERAESLSSAIQQRIDNAKLTEDSLAVMVEAERRKAKDMDNYLLKEQLMLGNIKRVEKLHELTLTKLSDFELADQALAGGRASVTVRLMEDPKEKERLVWPRPILFLPLCLVLGLAGGVGLICLRRSTDQPLTSRTDT